MKLRNLADALLSILDEADRPDLMERFVQFSNLCQRSPDLRSLLHDQSVPPRTIASAVCAVFSRLGTEEQLISQLLSFLERRRAWSMLVNLGTTMQDTYQQRHGQSRLTVWSASELTQTERQSLEQRLPASSQIQYHIDTSIFAGYVVQTDDHIVDLSMRAALDDLRKALVN